MTKVRDIETFKGVRQVYSKDYYRAIRDMMNSGVHFLVKVNGMNWMGSGGIGDGEEEIEKCFENQFHYVIHDDYTVKIGKRR